MTTKKNPQWKLDRGYNMNDENESKTFGLLSIISDIEKGKITEEEGLDLALSKSYIMQKHRYKQSTATLFKSYGLISENFVLTEISNAFLEKKITFKELILLQIIKKEYKYDDQSTVVRPFFVLVSVLLELRKRDIKQAWVDCFDYFNHLTEIKSMAEVSERVDRIIEDRELPNRKIIYKLDDSDIWYNVFVFLDILVEIGEEKKYKLAEDKIEFVSELLLRESKLPIICEYNHDARNLERKKRLDEFGELHNGLFLIFPEIKTLKGYSLSNLSDSYKEVVRCFLFYGKSFREIDSEVFSANSRGFLSKLICDSFGLEKQHKGLLKPYLGYENLLKMSTNCIKNKKLHDYLFVGEEEVSPLVDWSNSSEEYGINRIYYGIPGCGKSYSIKQILDYHGNYVAEANELGIRSKVKKENIIRTTFYHEYSNTDFVGQLMPGMEGERIVYKPILGPFTKALRRARQTDEMVFLIIEEINRGNAAAIFGDIFQLLDRYSDSNTGEKENSTYKKGRSMYPITNSFIEDHLNIIQGDVVIPSNLTILGTMNTADQSIYPLDSAFKRRWDLVKISSNWEAVERNFKEMYIPFTEYTWERFATHINKLIQEASKQDYELLDKQLGPYFINKNILQVEDKKDIDNFENNQKMNKFIHNVIDYLYNDVCRFDHSLIFNQEIGYDDLCKNILQYKSKKFEGEKDFNIKDLCEKVE